jgi:hypothetical protein
LSRQCSFTKADGERCRGSATGRQGLCYSHDPALAEERKRNGRRGGRLAGRGRPLTEESMRRRIHELEQRLLLQRS